jgi:hypothetical protein
MASQASAVTASACGSQSHMQAIQHQGLTWQLMPWHGRSDLPQVLTCMLAAAYLGLVSL